jgi:hypothetical protein
VKKLKKKKKEKKECIAFRTVGFLISVYSFGILWVNIMALDSKSGKLEPLLLGYDANGAMKICHFFAGVRSIEDQIQMYKRKTKIFVLFNPD